MLTEKLEIALLFRQILIDWREYFYLWGPSGDWWELHSKDNLIPPEMIPTSSTRILDRFPPGKLQTEMKKSVYNETD